MLRKIALVLLLGLAPASAVAHPHPPTVKSSSKARKAQRQAQVKAGKPGGKVSSKRQAKARRPKRKLRRGDRVARRAAGLVGVPLSTVSATVPDDCTGLARLAYLPLGIELMGGGQPGDNGVTAIYRRAQAREAVHQRRPRPGDLVFFRETYDRNRDGERNDGLTHIGVVEAVAKDGTVTFIHRGGGGVKRSVMNVQQPAVRGDRRRGYLNDWLRRASDSDRAYLTGELFAGYASVSRM